MVTYIEYGAGTTKGETTARSGDVGTLFNSPFGLGDVDSNYTSENVVERAEGDGTTKAFVLGFEAILDSGALKGGKVTVDGTASTAYTAATSNGVTTVTFTTAPADDSKIVFAYKYDNVIVPQHNELPTIKAEMKSIALLAKARRIAVYYSQIAAFQAKTDYGFDLGDQLAEKAVGQLSYEIDTEVVELLAKTAEENTTVDEKAQLTWVKAIPAGVSKAEHYEGFSEIVEIAKQIVYDRTKRFAPNYMLIASDVLPILTFIKGFSAAPTGSVNGPYFAGTLNGIKVYVSPVIGKGKFALGVNGDDMMSSVAVYAPYMAIVPTQLLQYADGGTTQGWSTMYDLKVLNKNLIVAGEVDSTSTQLVYTYDKTETD